MMVSGGTPLRGVSKKPVIFANASVANPKTAKCGFYLKFISVVLLTALPYFVIIPVLGLE